MEKKEHEFCLRCGRKLKKLQARELGYGPVCWQKIQNQPAGKKLFEGSRDDEKELGCQRAGMYL